MQGDDIPSNPYMTCREKLCPSFRGIMDYIRNPSYHSARKLLSKKVEIPQKGAQYNELSA